MRRSRGDERLRRRTVVLFAAGFFWVAEWYVDVEERAAACRANKGWLLRAARTKQTIRYERSTTALIIFHFDHNWMAKLVPNCLAAETGAHQ